MEYPVRITSLANPAIKRFKGLSTRRKQRYRDELFVAEGYRTILTLLDTGSEPVEILIGESIDETLLEELSAHAGVAEATITHVADAVIRQSSDTVNPQPMLAVFKMRRKELPFDCSFVLLIDGVQDPGNLGSMIRSAAAAGIDAAVTMPGTVDLYAPKVVRASTGLVESLPVGAARSLDEVLSRCFRTRPQIVLASADAKTDYTAVDWTNPSLLIVGNEAHGPQSAKSNLDEIQARIPMSETAESINVTAATAVFLFEANRQRSLK